MSSIVFLVVFVILSLIGGFLLWLRERGPRSMEAHMRAFERELEALSPETPIDGAGLRGRNAQPRPRGPYPQPRPRGPNAQPGPRGPNAVVRRRPPPQTRARPRSSGPG